MPQVKVTGGKKLKAFVEKAKKAQGVRGVEVGFYSTSRYEDGTPVTNVAAGNEFGTEYIPERPFFRLAIAQMEESIPKVIEQSVDPETMVIDPITAERVGLKAQSEIQSSITKLREPENAPSTIRRKGSSNPLVDTGFMREQVSYVVES